MKSNPLATRYVAPGRIAWVSTSGAPDLQQLADQCGNQYRLRCALVGAHGSGKSTLVEHLIPLLGIVVRDQAASPSLAAAIMPVSQERKLDSTPAREIVRMRLRGWWASSRLLMSNVAHWLVPQRVLIIDGYEQLPRIVRAFVLWATWLRGTGLIVTSHRPTALPTLVTLSVDPQLARQLLDQLLPLDTQGREELLDVQNLQQRLNKHHGNLRELFMELYDVLEQ